jgi:hypothetical protein
MHLIDPNTMTLGEVERFEELSGLRIADLSPERMTTRGLLALIVIKEQRENPGYSMDDARALRVSDVEWLDPTKAADEVAMSQTGRPSRRSSASSRPNTSA